ncbi:hypothetical protein P43SY_009081 [Pythium insidiosum]|uniref:Uncharacterized protein n=1 Tax=Pythium insidiosum TaxID=114742 RepID=A0AAD5MAA7_PYTIN|nr:hypothetical protein P43SY_009081 [Pythium insidiosum]
MAPPKDDVLSALVTSAARVLAPNSLQFDENELERASKEAREAATQAAKLVQPGDLIFITTQGFLYSVARFLANNEYDHVVVVLNASEVLHVGPPSSRVIQLERLLLPHRQPVVLRPSMSDDERARFVRCARQLIGTKYDVVRVYQLILRLTLQHLARRTPLRRLALDSRCSEQFRQALRRVRDEVKLDIVTHGSASFNDFTRIRQHHPDTLVRVPLPVLNFTLNPHRRPGKAYFREFVELMLRIRSGKLRWHLLEDTVLPRLRDVAGDVSPRLATPQRLQLVAYTVVFLVLLKRASIVRRVLLRAAQLLLLRYVIQQVLMHVKLDDMARAMVARL